MRILMDSSVLIAGMVAVHPKYHAAFSWFKKVQSGEVLLVVSAHSLLECYAVLTKLPSIPKINPSMAMRLIETNIIKHAELIFLTSREYSLVIRHVSSQGLSGGIVYDALILKAAEKAKVNHLLTSNTKDFYRLTSDVIFSSFILTL